MGSNRTFLHSLILWVLLLADLPGLGQIPHGGRPAEGPFEPQKGEVPFIELSSPNEDSLLRRDSIQRMNGEKILRFAENLEVDLDVQDTGIRTETRDGRVVHRLGIYSQGARSLSFAFAPYDLVQGARLFIYTPDQGRIRGSFTQENRTSDGRMTTVPIPGDRAVIELVEPKGKEGASRLGVERISHAYRRIPSGQDGGRDYGDAGDCNMNVNCPDGDPWRAQKRAVGMLIVNGDRLCSGVLVNNTAEDGTPYFLTADHCLENASGPPSGWSFVFNYESPDCADQQASLDQSISGSTLRAHHEDSDFCLVEMADTPPSSYGVFYAGWDRSGTAPDSSVSIHHPNGDIKKISFDDDQAASGQFGNSIPNGEWHVQQWDRNTTTEYGSSGCPFFDPEGRVKGQLHGGAAQCGNSVDDFFGKFSVSWDHHAAQDSQLQYWLDPLNNNPADLEGYDPRVGIHPNDVAITSFLSPQRDICKDEGFGASIEIRNHGSQPLDSLRLYLLLESDTLEKVDWTGPLASGEYDTVNFSNHNTSDTGKLLLLAGTRFPNGQPDGDPSDDTLSMELRRPSDAREVAMDIQTDCYGSETAWELWKEGGDTLYSLDLGSYPGTGSNPYEGGTQESYTFCLEQGCYEFILKDDYGDGMNGGQYPGCDINGSLRIENEKGGTLAKLLDPDFGTDTILSFCTDSSIVRPQEGEDGVWIFPNPNHGSFRLRVNGDPGSYRLGIYDMRGRRVLFRKFRMKKSYMDRRVQLPSVRSGGIYLLRLKGAFGQEVKKLFIDR